MKMVEVKVSELGGAALDWAVCFVEAQNLVGKPISNDMQKLVMQTFNPPFSPSTNWAQCGPLIEKYQVRFDHRRIDCGKVIASADGMMYDHGIPGCDSYLVAACRAIVAAKIGDTVSLPAELVECGQ